jgi:valyl-tRNA synthetase
MGSKFANKVWNASRYILMNLEGREVVENPALLPVDRWIYSRLGTAAGAMEAAFLSYRYNDAAQAAYEFFWNDFCDWYVEATKLSMREGDEAEKNRATTVLLEVLAESLRLLHPLIPFVTEEIYGKLPYKGRRVSPEDGAGLLINAPYPKYDAARSDPGAEADFAFIRELVTLVRTLRSECTVSPDKKMRVLVRPGDAARSVFLAENAGLVRLLAGIGDLEIAGNLPEAEGGAVRGAIGLAGSGFEAFVFIAGAVDLAFLKQKFSKDLAKDGKFITGLRAKLSNENFLKNAPPELVEQEKAKLEEAQKRAEKLESYIRDLG